MKKSPDVRAYLHMSVVLKLWAGHTGEAKDRAWVTRSGDWSDTKLNEFDLFTH